MSENQARLLTRIDAPAIPPLPEAVTADTMGEWFAEDSCWSQLDIVEKIKTRDAARDAHWQARLNQAAYQLSLPGHYCATERTKERDAARAQVQQLQAANTDLLQQLQALREGVGNALDLLNTRASGMQMIANLKLGIETLVAALVATQPAGGQRRGLDLPALEAKLDAALESETAESLSEFLDSRAGGSHD